MPPSGTFDYFSIVPPEHKRQRDWRVQLTERVFLRWDALCDARLVGHAPVLAITACEPALKPGDTRMMVPRSRFTLKASSRRHAPAAAASFYVDQSMLSVFQTGDRFYMSRTASAGLGLSLIRDGRLVFAAGAITSVPLGNVQAHTPFDLVREAEQVFRRHDAEFAFPEFPVQIEIDGELRIINRGYRTINRYEVSLMHGFYPRMPGVNERAAITLRDTCKHSIASNTAQFLDSMDVEIEYRPVGL